MFSSLEALDAQTSLQPPPVARHGAFQPKAKPRSRKTAPGASSSVAPTPIPSKKSPQQPNIDGAVPSIPQDFPVLPDSPLPAARHQNNQAALCNDVASAADRTASKETAARNYDEAHKTLNRTVAFELCPETSPAESPLPPDIAHNEFGSPGGRATTNSDEVNLETVVNTHDADKEECQASEENVDMVGTQRLNITGINTVLPDEAVPQRRLDIFTRSSREEDTQQLHPNALDVAGRRKDKKRRRSFNVQQEANENEKSRVVSPGNLECQETNGKIRRQKKARVKKATHEETVVETGVDNSNQTSPQEDTEQRHSDALELVEPVKSSKRRCHRSHVQQEATETVSPPKTKESSTETSKPRQRRLATFAAVSSVETQQGAELAANGDTVPEPVSQVEEGQGKKRLKRATLQKKKVEKRALNPVDPNLDPKKLTMKDIIRLAEAKERKSKEGTARRPKDSSDKTPVNGEAGEEQEQNERTTFAPQVHVVDGRIVINQESLTVAAHPVNDIRQYKRVEETHSKLNYHSYMKKTPKKVWREEDTDLFYEALREFGTNFALMQHLFPGRTRRQIFLKFKKEERACPRRLAEAMTRKPSEYLQFREVINRLNLIPDQAHGALASEQASVLPETASTREELEDSTSTLLEEVSPPSEMAETDGLQIDVSMSKSGKSGESTHASNVGADFEPVRNLTSAEDCEIPKEESSPPGVKSSSSNKNLTSKRSKSLFSYQHF